MRMSCLTGKTILITGGAGSFGQAFCRLVLKEHNPKAVRVFDISEIGEVNMRRAFDNDQRLRFFIGDVRDARRLKRALHGVDIVVHAAALKHIDVCEYNPIEAVKTNVEGAIDVIDGCIDEGVEKVMAVSTDKAAYPVNLYGASKMVAEKLFVQGNTYSHKDEKFLRTIFSCTRYGNVIGSSGSVVPLFQEQAKKGEITLTDERMTRFWITLDAGVRFVISCLEKMKGGEIFVPKIPSMKIMDLIKQIAPTAKIKVIGIRPGEKIHEILITKEEARHTKETEDYFIICPEFNFWQEDEALKKCPCLTDDFTYSSDTNKQWMTPEELKKIVDDK